MRELAAATRVQWQQLVQSDGAGSDMQTALNTLRAQRRSGIGVGVETMNVCCLANVNGIVSAVWLCQRTQSSELKNVTQPMFNAGLLVEAGTHASSELLLELRNLFLHSTSGPALNRVVSARSGEDSERG